MNIKTTIRKGWLVLLALSTLFAVKLEAQELECKVTINHSQVQGTNVQVFETLKTALTEFINDRQWTQAQYAVNERIRCSLNLTVKTYDETEGRWECDLTVQSNRPVFQSNYQSVVFSFRDPDVAFNYQEFEPLELNMNQIDNNLVAVIAYYVYTIIGWDMDTMAPMGGTDVLRMAESIVTQAQMLGETGWKPFEDSRNRYALVTDYLDEGMSPLRQLMYDYHRVGLDEMAVNATRSRATITTALEQLKKARDNKPMASLPVIFTEIKADELINIYGGTSPSAQAERDKVHDLLSSINASKNQDWEEIKRKD